MILHECGNKVCAESQNESHQQQETKINITLQFVILLKNIDPVPFLNIHNECSFLFLS